MPDTYSSFSLVPSAKLTFFVFHNPIAKGHEKVETRGFVLDHSTVDFSEILNHFVLMAKGYHPDARVLYVTGPGGIPLADVDTVILDLDGTEPMYDRVTAMHSFAHSDAFSATVFLDSDAFVNRPLTSEFGNFDIGVTVREGVKERANEGVIFCAGTPAARHFFELYLEAYKTLPKDKRRWEGGQRSLNLVLGSSGFNGTVKEYPVETHNFTPRSNTPYSHAQLAAKYIIHLKGKWKSEAAPREAYLNFQRRKLAADRNQA